MNKKKELKEKTEDCFNFASTVVCKVCRCQDEACDCNLEER